MRPTRQAAALRGARPAWTAFAAVLALTLHPATLRAQLPEPQTPTEAAQLLAMRLGMAESNRDAADAVSEILAWAGIPTVSLKAGKVRTVRAARPPAVPFVGVWDVEVARLATQARARARGQPGVEIEDLGRLLEAGGWRPARDRSTAAALRMILSAALDSAMAAPDGPHAFVPLFLHAAATQRGEPFPREAPPADGAGGLEQALAALGGAAAMGGDDDEDGPARVYELSTLEAMLFVAAHVRGAAPRVRSGAIAPPGPSAMPAGRGPFALDAALGDPCSDLLDGLGEWKWAELAVLDWLSSTPFGALYDKLGVSELGGMAGATALKLLKATAALFAQQIRFELEPTAESAHYSEGDLAKFSWNAKVGVQTEDVYDSDAARIASDCAGALGFAVADSRAQVMDAASKWTVHWILTGLNGHATMARDMKLVRHNGYHSALQASGDELFAIFKADMAFEKPDAWRNPDAEEKRGRMRLRAELDQSTPPDFGTLAKSVLAGVTGAMPVDIAAELLIELMKKLMPRSATSSVEVSWHGPRNLGWYGTIAVEDVYESFVRREESRPNGDRSSERTDDRKSYTVEVEVKPAELPRARVDFTQDFATNSMSSWKNQCAVKSMGEEVRTVEQGQREVSNSALRASGYGPVQGLVIAVDTIRGRYRIAFTAPTVEGRLRGKGTKSFWDGCEGAKPGDPTPEVPSDLPARFEGRRFQIEGEFDRTDPDHLELELVIPPGGDRPTPTEDLADNTRTKAWTKYRMDLTRDGKKPKPKRP